MSGVGVAGEANFLGGVAKLKGVLDFDVAKAKKRFFEIYITEVNLFCGNAIRWLVAGSYRIREWVIIWRSSSGIFFLVGFMCSSGLSMLFSYGFENVFHDVYNHSTYDSRFIFIDD